MSDSSGHTEDHIQTIPIDMVCCPEDHIRKSSFSLHTLKGTIEDAGLLQPILVSRADDGGPYNVIDGARRLAALRELGVHELIVGRDIIVDVDETEADVCFKQVIANVQREDLNSVELGHAFVAMKEVYRYKYNEIAEIIGKTPHFVTAKVGLVKRLDPEVQRRYLEDVENEKGIQSTFSGDHIPYVMNVNILEDIARAPKAVQMAAYEAIRDGRMSKEIAIMYLRTLKNRPEETALPPGEEKRIACEGMPVKHELNIRNQVLNIAREIEILADSIMGDSHVEPETVAEIEALIGQLSQLCARLKADEVKRPEKSMGWAG